MSNFKRSHIILVLFLVWGYQQVQAQEYLIRQFPRLDTIPSTVGANRTHYYASFFGFGSLFGPTDSSGSNINTQRSYWICSGWRYKRKHSAFFNTGSDVSVEVRNFNLAQTSKKVFAGQFTHKKERLFQVTLNYSIFFRFNLVKRGNHLGKYIDLYGTGIYAPLVRHYTYDPIDPAYGAKNGKHVFSRLQYAQRWFAQVGLRYGISFFQLQVFYRPLNMFKKTDQFPYPELPRFGAGILIDIERRTDKK